MVIRRYIHLIPLPKWGLDVLTHTSFTWRYFAGEQDSQRPAQESLKLYALEIGWWYKLTCIPAFTVANSDILPVPVFSFSIVVFLLSCSLDTFLFLLLILFQWVACLGIVVIFCGMGLLVLMLFTLLGKYSDIPGDFISLMFFMKFCLLLLRYECQSG